MKNVLLGLVLVSYSLPHAGYAEPVRTGETEVQVAISGEAVHIDVRLEVEAPPRVAWAVFTDYEHMTDILSNLKVSRVVKRNGNVLEVYQQGRAEHGLLSYSFESTREFRLTPYRKIEFHLLQGSMRKMDGVLTLQPGSHGTQVRFRVDSIPDTVLPPALGKAFIEHETREQFEQWRREILRRAALPNAVRAK